MIKNATLSITGLGLMSLLALPAHAAPPTGAGLAAAAPASSVEKTAYYGRRCWRRHGKLYCRQYVRRAYPYAYYDGWGPGWGYGPGLGFYFGGGGHRGWGGGHHGFHGGGGHRHR